MKNAAVRLAGPVALLPVWPAIHAHDAERRWSLAQADAIGAAVRLAYEGLGHRVIEVPRGSVEERADWLMRLWGLGATPASVIPAEAGIHAPTVPHEC